MSAPNQTLGAPCKCCGATQCVYILGPKPPMTMRKMVLCAMCNELQEAGANPDDFFECGKCKAWGLLHPVDVPRFMERGEVDRTADLDNPKLAGHNHDDGWMAGCAEPYEGAVDTRYRYKGRKRR